jgi:hypothetical protein
MIGGEAPSQPAETKLIVGQIDDPLEHEADRVTDQVMRIPASNLTIEALPTELPDIPHC